MVILHNAIKTIQNGVFMFFEKRMKTCFFKKKKQKRDFEKTGGLEFFENTGFLSTLTIFQSFLWFPWSHDLEQLTTLSVWLGVRRTSRVKDHYNEEAENYWHFNT